MANKQTETKKPAQGEKLPLGKVNYIMIAVCLLLIIIGFFLMGGSPNEGTTFNEHVFDTRRVVVGPLVSLVGFVLMAFAIIYRKKNDK